MIKSSDSSNRQHIDKSSASFTCWLCRLWPIISFFHLYGMNSILASLYRVDIKFKLDNAGGTFHRVPIIQQELSK